jgi:hypothetical protein
MQVRFLLDALLDARPASSMRAAVLQTGNEGQIPSLATVAESKAAEDLDCESRVRGFESFRPPQASVAQRRPRLTVNQVSHTMVRVHPGAPGFR